MKKYLIAIMIFLSLVGCNVTPNKQELNNAYYGRVIDQKEAEEIVKDFMATRLKDPYSAVYDFGIVYKSFYQENFFEGNKLYTGYQLTANINAKNSFGGYIGVKTYLFIINDGTVIKAVELTGNGINKDI